MPILGDPKLTRTLPLAMFERLQELLKQMQSTLGEGAVLLTENVLFQDVNVPTPPIQRFAVLVSERFSVLLFGEPHEPEPVAEYGSTSRLYQVELTFDPEAIATFLMQLTHDSSYSTRALNGLHPAQNRLQPNDPTIQSEFTLALIEILASGEAMPYPPNASHGNLLVCKPIVEEALSQQLEQERLLNQVTTQIRQSLELPVILETAVEQVRQFLQVDRLLIYQFDEFNCSSVAAVENTSSSAEKTEPFKGQLIAPTPLLASTIRWGCVTYEARASSNISSVLNLIEKENTSNQISNCRDKYFLGHTLSIDDIETAYPNSSCLLELLRQSQVRAMLAVPIIVQDKLWGLLIAHQCFQPRSWKEAEKTFLKLIGEHLSVAIYQAQLYAQLQQQKNSLEHRVIERTQELRDILQAAEAANRAKGDFLAMMSHELRTPLTCIIGMSATLLRWSFGQEGLQRVPLHKQRRYLKTIQESGEHLLELINDILDLSQFEAGKAVLNVSQFSLSKLIQQTLRTFQEKAYLRRVDLQLDLRVKSQEERFCADKRRVKQILFNLLGNAIKFTHADGKVTLRAWREQNLAIFQVEDTGIGIAPDQLPLLFQKFQQLETTYHRNYEGTGLGLALTKQLVELHGGRIDVESVVGKGSLFTVWLPDQPLVSSKATANHKKNSNSHGSIVLVEDDGESAALICEVLTAAGYHVVWLIDGSTALAQIELLQPKAVIVDWQLRGMDGYEITYCLRSSPSTQHIKVLALTTHAITKEQEIDLSTIADDYLVKPIKQSQLLRQVTILMKH